MLYFGIQLVVCGSGMVGSRAAQDIMLWFSFLVGEMAKKKQLGWKNVMYVEEKMFSWFK